MRCFLFVLLFFSSFSRADDKIVVSATRTSEQERNLPFSVGTVSGSSWASAGESPENALSAVPGLSFSSGGGPGQPRSVFLRGAKAEHTLVLIDGVPVNDPLSPSRSFDFGLIPAHEIDRVEIIKGPQSVLYGSDAMGGVVHVITKKKEDWRAFVEAGSFRTLRTRASGLGFHAGYEESKGFSAADANDGNAEPDGFSNWNLGGQKQFPLSNSALLRLIAHYEDSRADTDRHGGRGGDSTGTSSRSSHLLFRGESEVLLDEKSTLSLGASYSGRDRNDTTNSPSGDTYQSNLIKAEGSLRWDLGPHTITAGIEASEEAGRSTQISNGYRRFRGGALYVQDQFAPGRFHSNLGARLDLHSEHEKAWNGRGGLGYWLLPDQLRAKASLGTGFKAPSLYQALSIYGSPALLPERSLGADLGLEAIGEEWRAELTAFRNLFRDQIDFNPTTSRFFNQSRAETYGLELSGDLALGYFHLSNATTWMRAFDRDTRAALLRRPEFSNALTGGFQKGDFVGAHLRLRYVGSRTDIHPTLFTRQLMPDFLTLGFDMFHHLGSGMKARARIENILNRQYQETSGFGEPGLSAYAGLEADL